MSYGRSVTETSLGRIGGLIGDARKHRGLTQTQLATVLGTSQSAVHRIEAGNQNLSLDMVNRIAAALDAPIISFGPTGPTHLRVRGGAKLNGTDRGPQLEERRRGAAVCQPAEPWTYRHPGDRQDRGGQPDPRGADQHRRPSLLVAGRQRPRTGPPRHPRSGRDGRRRRPPDPQRDHVPRTAAALLPAVPAAVRRWLRPRRPDHRAPSAGASSIRSRRGRHRRLLPVHGR